MTSAKFSDFWTPSPPCHCPIQATYQYYRHVLTNPPPSPSVRTSFKYRPTGAMVPFWASALPLSASTSTRQLSSSDKKSGRRTNGREEEESAARFPRLTNRSLPCSPIRFGFIFRLFGVALNLWSVTEERRPSIEGDGRRQRLHLLCSVSLTRLLFWLLNSTGLPQPKQS